MPVSQMHLPTNIVSPNYTAFHENRTALGKTLGEFFRFSNSFLSPQVKRSVTNMKEVIDHYLN